MSEILASANHNMPRRSMRRTVEDVRPPISDMRVGQF